MTSKEGQQLQEEIERRTVALAAKTGKLTGQVLQAAMRKSLATRQRGTGRTHHGKQSLRQLKKDGSTLSNIKIINANVGLFRPCAKKYGISFTLRRDCTARPPRYIVILKPKQADNLEQALKESTTRKLKQQERPPIQKALSAMKQEMMARNHQQAKEKIKGKRLPL